MPSNGLLIDYEYCTGCHSCEIAGKEEHQLPIGKWCIKVAEEAPWKVNDERWEYKFVPIPTQLCDLCEDRVNKGKDPTCVHHCQAHVMQYGSLDVLAQKAAEKGTKVAIFVP